MLAFLDQDDIFVTCDSFGVEHSSQWGKKDLSVLLELFITYFGELRDFHLHQFDKFNMQLLQFRRPPLQASPTTLTSPQVEPG